MVRRASLQSVGRDAVAARTTSSQAAYTPLIQMCTGLFLAWTSLSAPNAVAAPLSQGEAANYAQLHPYEFVKQRFFEEDRKPVMDGIERAAKGYASFIDKLNGKKTSSVPADAGRPKATAYDELRMVTWPAHFTNRNYSSLLQPANDLRRYCNARRGTFRTIEADTADPIALLRQDPVTSFVDAHQRVTRSLRATNAYAGFEEFRDVIATDVAHEAMEEAKQRNRRLEALFSLEGFGFAQRLHAFGTFECAEEGQPRWVVSVIPSVLLGRDASNGLDSSMARLAIRLYPAIATPRSAQPNSARQR